MAHWYLTHARGEVETMVIRGYVRISKLTDESMSLEIQREKIEIARDASYPGAEIVFYPDESVSGGKDLEDRKQGKRLLDEIQSGDVLICTRMDRLGRNAQDLLKTAKTCETIGATLRFTEHEGLSTDNPYGQVMFTMLAAFAQFERELIRERTEGDRKSALAKGLYRVGRLPFWLEGVGPEGKKVVRPNHRAPEFKAAIESLLKHETTQAAVADQLGIHPTTLGHHLRNSWLYGRNPENGSVIDDQAAILSMVQWKQLQSGLTTQTWTRRESYAHILRCYRCGKPLHFNKASLTYWCHGSDPSHDGRPAIKRAVVDAQIEEWFLTNYGDLPTVEEIKRDDSAEIQEQLARIDVELAHATETMLKDDADVLHIAERLVALKAQRRALALQPTRPVVEYRPTGRTVRDAWQSADSQHVKMLEKFLTITVWPARGEQRRTERLEFQPVSSSVRRFIERTSTR